MTTTTTILIRNNNPAFGDAGPFEAESVEAFMVEAASENGFLRGLAADCLMHALNAASHDDDDGGPYPMLPGETREQYIARVTVELSDEFEHGLEVVE